MYVRRRGPNGDFSIPTPDWGFPGTKEDEELYVELIQGEIRLAVKKINFVDSEVPIKQ